MKHWILIAFLTFNAAELHAQSIPAPRDLDDTLDLMTDYLLVHPDVESVVRQEDKSLLVIMPDQESVVLYPDNLTAYLQTAPSDEARQNVFDNHMETMINSLVRNDTASANGFTLDQLMPVIRDSAYVSGLDTGFTFISEEFGGELSIFLVIDYPDRVEFLHSELLESAGFDVEQAFAAAEQNLQKRFAGITIESSSEIPISWFLLDGYFESSFILLDEFWVQMAADYEELIMIVPNRDYLVYGDASNDLVRPFLARLADDVDAQFNGALSAELFRWTESGWVLD